jgi:hypothetical protein
MSVSLALIRSRKALGKLVKKFSKKAKEKALEMIDYVKKSL